MVNIVFILMKKIMVLGQWLTLLVNKLRIVKWVVVMGLKKVGVFLTLLKLLVKHKKIMFGVMMKLVQLISVHKVVVF